MHLALLVTNTDESDFAQRHPKDGVKFPTMMAQVRPDWRFDIFSVKDDIFPENLDRFDGIMITGSPASVHDDAPWIERLLGLIRHADALSLPMFGACFGHQAIALALGGSVGHNPRGYIHGRIKNQITNRRPWMAALPTDFDLYGSHQEQVVTLPPHAQTIATSIDCPIAGFAIGNKIYTTQHHPEMTPAFMQALTDEMADYLGSDIAKKALASLHKAPDADIYAESIARFFEQVSKST